MNEECSGTIFDGWHYHPCHAKGKYNEDSRLWCGNHAPSKVAARQAKRQAIIDSKLAVRQSIWEDQRKHRERTALCLAVCEGVPSDILKKTQILMPKPGYITFIVPQNTITGIEYYQEAQP